MVRRPYEKGSTESDVELHFLASDCTFAPGGLPGNRINFVHYRVVHREGGVKNRCRGTELTQRLVKSGELVIRGRVGSGGDAAVRRIGRIQRENVVQLDFD